MNLSQDDEEKIVLPIDAFIRNSKAESSQNIFDLNKQSPLYSLFE